MLASQYNTDWLWDIALVSRLGLTIMTAIQVAMGWGSPEYGQRKTLEQLYSMLCASVISQEAALEALEHGAEAAAEMKEKYFTVEQLADSMGE